MQHHKLRDIAAKRPPLCVAPDTKVIDVVKTMQERRLGAALVIENGELLGIFTGANFVKQVLDAGRDPSTTQIKKVMTQDPKSLDCECQGFDAVRMMEENHIRHIVVRNFGQNGYGLVCITDFPDSELDEYEDELSFENRLWEEM